MQSMSGTATATRARDRTHTTCASVPDPPTMLVYHRWPSVTAPTRARDCTHHMCFCSVPANRARVPQVAICHGPYPRELIKSWHAWDRKNGSENEPVDAILKPASSSKADAAAAQAAAAAQLYLVLAMGDSGRDLEKHVLSRGLEEATAILVQVWGGGGVERQRCGEVEVWRPAH